MQRLGAIVTIAFSISGDAVAADHLAAGPRTVVFRFGYVWAVLDFVTNKCDAKLGDNILNGYIELKARDPEIFGLGYDSGTESINLQEQLYGLAKVCSVQKSLYGAEGSYLPKQAIFPPDQSGN